MNWFYTNLEMNIRDKGCLTIINTRLTFRETFGERKKLDLCECVGVWLQQWCEYSTQGNTQPSRKPNPREYSTQENPTQGKLNPRNTQPKGRLNPRNTQPKGRLNPREHSTQGNTQPRGRLNPGEDPTWGKTQPRGTFKSFRPHNSQIKSFGP